MYMRVASAIFMGGARKMLPALTRRALIRASVAYIGVPMTLDSLITIVSRDKLNETTQTFAVIAGSALIAYGPSRAYGLLRSAVSTPKAAAAFMRAAPLALTAQARLQYGRVAAMMSKVAIRVVPGATAGARALVIDLPKYGSVTFNVTSKGITVSASSALLAGLMISNGFSSTTSSVTFDDVALAAMQIAATLVAELQEHEEEQVEEELFKADPLSLFARLPLLGDAIARENPLMSRQHIAAMALKAVATEVVVQKGMFFDMYVDEDGDSVLSLDGTKFGLRLPGIGSSETTLDMVHPADRTAHAVPMKLRALGDGVIDMFDGLAKMGRIPFIKADGDLVYSPPFPITIEKESYVLCLTFTEEGLMQIQVYEDGWFTDANEKFDSASTRDFFEARFDDVSRAARGTGTFISEALDGAAEYFANAVGFVKDPKVVEAQVTSTENRLKVEPGTVIFYYYSELEGLL